MDVEKCTIGDECVSKRTAECHRTWVSRKVLYITRAHHLPSSYNIISTNNNIIIKKVMNKNILFENKIASS